jgi:hypothetical protein
VGAGLSVDPAGNVFVLSSTPAAPDDDRVFRFDSFGNPLGSWGINGSGAGELETPRDLAAGPGEVWLLDQESGGIMRVQRHDSNGALLSQWETPQGLGTDRIALSPDGTVYLGSRSRETVYAYTPDGSLRTSWAAAALQDLETDGAGDVYVAE